MISQVRACLLLGFVLSVLGQEIDVLPGTSRWNFPAEIVAEQYKELRGFYEKRIGVAARERGKFWPAADWSRTVEKNRDELRRAIGAVDPFLKPAPVTKRIAETPAFTFSLVEWPVLPLGNLGSTSGSSGALVKQYGILLEPKRPGKHPAVVAIPDAHQSPADVTGLSLKLPQREQFARSLAVNGYVVYVPFFVQRRAFSLPWTDDRNWLVRLGYQVGRHLIGSEVQQVSSAVDYLSMLPGVDAGRIGVVGTGQGGLTALYAAALDTRLQSTLVANYFDRRDGAYEEPEDRILWNHLERFGDAEIAAMIAPRAMLIDRGGAYVQEEYARARTYFERAGAGGALRYSGERDQEHGPTTAALERFDEVLHPDIHWMISPPQSPQDPEPLLAIANAQFAQWQARFRNLAMEAYARRGAATEPDTSSAEGFEEWRARRYEVYLDTTGRYPAAAGPLAPQSVLVYDEPEFRGYRLSVRVYDGVHAYGILLVPKNIRPGEKRPVVFTQHGQGGRPEDALGVVDNARADAVYTKFGRAMARHGYVVFAPMISTQAAPERNALVRRAHLVGLTPVGMEIRKAARVLDFLETLPYVDKDRFAFYGLSYGGFTALWTGAGEQRFKAVVCSGYFNDWNIKTTDLTEGTSFLFYKDTFDMFNFGMLDKFNHSDLAMLTAPRAFMIEIGVRDGIVVEPRRFVEAELARVMDVYRKLGIAEKGRVARFDGPHRVDGVEAFPFIDRMLGWKGAR